MKNQLFVLQLGGDLIFPLLGYFLWDWSLYFILLFLILDMLCTLVVTHLKARKIKLYQSEKSFPFGKSALSIILLCVTLFLLHLMMIFHKPTINFPKEMIAFWNYKDMGIAQGYFLAPLLIVMSWQLYKIEFLMPALYRTQSQKTLWKQHYFSYCWLMAYAGIGIGQIVLLQVNELVLFIVLCLVLLTRAISSRFT